MPFFLFYNLKVNKLILKIENLQIYFNNKTNLEFIYFYMNFFNDLILSKENLLNNIKIIKKTAGEKKICAMVKANAYQHNLKFVVTNLKNYVDFFGVSNTEEAISVRNLTNKKILICGLYDKENLKNLILNNISLTITSIKQLKEIVLVVKNLQKEYEFNKNIDKNLNYVCDGNCINIHNIKAKIHIKINTGMNRLGVKNINYFKKILNFISVNNQYLILEGIYSHLFNAENTGLARTQYYRFLNFLNFLPSLDNLIIHLENSRGLFNNVDFFKVCNMARVGIALYGLEIKNKGLKPVLSLNSKIVAIQKVKFDDYVGYGKEYISKNGKVGVVPIGYADGIVRSYKNAFVFVNNVPCKILNVCMDMIIIDVTNIKTKIYDNVEIISNLTNKLNSANSLAKHLNTIAYEIVTNIKHSRLNIKFN